MDQNNYPTNVKLVEVGPRDGLQNEKITLSVKDKVAFIDALSNTGIKHIEAGSFVSPRWVPQMANSQEVFTSINKHIDITYSALVPNLIGAQAAVDANVNEIAIFSAASETFSKKNTNCSIDESIAKFVPVLTLAKLHNIPVRGYVSCAFGCPYEGKVDPSLVLSLSENMLAMGCYEISLGDTIGVGTPKSVYRLLATVLSRVEKSKIALHMHDTYGQALANVLIGLQEGLTTFDAAVAGLGGCPYAKGSSGNLATEDLVYMLQHMGINTGIDLHVLTTIGDKICKTLNRKNQSKAANTLLNLKRT